MENENFSFSIGVDDQSGSDCDYNVRGMEKVWRRRDYKRVGVSTYLLLDFEARVFTYYAPCND